MGFTGLFRSRLVPPYGPAWKPGKHGYRRGWGVLLAVVGVSLFVTFLLRQHEHDEVESALRREFAARAQDVHDRIRHRMATYEQALRGTMGFFAGSRAVSREGFRAYTGAVRIKENYPGIRGFGFCTIVAASRLAAHERAVRREGPSAYRVWPAGSRDVYTPVLYLEPHGGGNPGPFGYDMFVVPARRAAMERSRDSAAPAITGRMHLLNDREPGFVMYLPVFRNGAPAGTPAERREAITGWVFAPFRMVELMAGILGDHQSDLDIDIYDGHAASGDSMMYDSGNDGPTWADRGLVDSRIIIIAGHEWTVVISALSGFDERRRPSVEWTILAGGCGISLLLGFIAWLMIHGRAIALRFARDRETRYKTLMTQANDAIFLVRPDRRIAEANGRALEHFGYTMEEMRALRLEQLCPPENAEAVIARFDAVMRAGADRFESVHLRSDGTVRPVELSRTVVDVDGERLVVSFARDITERRKAEALLRSAAEEKAVLLKEIHHRVKNNLNVVASLLSMQSAYARVPEDEALFEEARDRIIAMSRIHEKLYRSDSLSAVDIGGYIRELVQGLAMAHSRPDVTLRFGIDRMDLGLDRAVPLGLIVNELVTNCYKYAFPQGKGGEIAVGLRPEGEGRFVMTVSDDGVGLPASLDPRTPLTLGLNLVNILTEQIEGTLRIDRASGTAYMISFPA